MKKIALCMIVKNEAHIVTRCLNSLREIVDYVLIEDTGSNDGTQAVVREWLVHNGMAGEIYDHPWQNFAYNRTHVLEKLRQNESIDFGLMMDADDIFFTNSVVDLNNLKLNLNAHFYDIEIRSAATTYYRPHLFSNKIPFKYRGVLHEFIEKPDIQLEGKTLQGVWIDSRREGARSQDPNKYARDAEILKEALTNDSDPFMQSRYCFYLAQSLRDSGQKQEAITYYLKRAQMKFWDEESYVALLNAGRLMTQVPDTPEKKIEDIFEEAIALKPERVEAVVSYAHHLRLKNQYAKAVATLVDFLGKPVPKSGLFIEAYAYQIGIWDEYSVSAYWDNNFKESLRASLEILKQEHLQTELRNRVIRNAQFALQKL